MNKIVRDNYPIEQLPDDLRGGFDPKQTVRVIVEQTDANHLSADDLRRLLLSALQAEPIGDDPVDRIRKLRDEWED